MTASVQASIISGLVATVEGVTPRTPLTARRFRHDDKAWDPAGLDQPRTFCLLLETPGSIAGHMSASHESAQREAVFGLYFVYALKSGSVRASLAALAEDADDLIRALEDATGWHERVSGQSVAPAEIRYTEGGFALMPLSVTVTYEV